jgi:RND family efflux transporter MFP subunit
MLKKVLLPLFILIAAVMVTAAMLRMRPEPEQSPIQEQTLLVQTLTVTPEDSRITVASQGTVEARTRTNLVSEVSGRVIEVAPAFVAGGFFRKGDVLLKLDDQNHRAAVSRNQAAVATAYSALELERGQGDVALREWDRMTADRQAQVRARELYLRKPQLAEAEARLASAQADLDEAQMNLAKTTIVAPYDGLVSMKNADIGQFVNAGTALAETFAVDYAEVRLPIPENKLAFLELPAAISNSTINNPQNAPIVTLQSNLGERALTWEGHLTRTEGVLDTRTRVLFSVVQVKDPYGLYGTEREEPLRIGTYVNAAIEGRLLESVYVLPRHTLQANNQVWVADQENRLRARAVTVLTTNGDDAYISAGLQPGDRVVITRMENPLNGMAVQTESAWPEIN